MERNNSLSKDEQYALEIFSSEAYLTVNKKLLQYYGPDTSIFLSNLIDKYKYFLNNDKLEDGWFFLTHESQIEQTGLSVSKIRTCKTILKENSILEVKSKGIPAKEWYKLNLTSLLHIIPSRHVSVGQAVTFPEGYIKETKSNIIPPPKKITSKERNKQYYPIAEFLANIILTKKNMQYTTIQILSWTNDIRQLSENNKVSIPRIKDALKWYRNHIGEQYCPVIESGKSLKEKFPKLEAAIQRENNPSQDSNYKCLIPGWKFGKSFDDSLTGCRNCEEDEPKLYRHCRAAHANLTKN